MPPEKEQAALLQYLGRMAEAANGRELGFIAVNELHAIVPYRQAALWFDQGGLQALSGVVSIEDNAPYSLYLRSLFAYLHSSSDEEQVRLVRPGELPERLAKSWSEWLPTQAVLLSLTEPGAAGCLLLVRDEPWTPAEFTSLGMVAKYLGLAFNARRSARRMFWLGSGSSSGQDVNAPLWRRVWRQPMTWLVLAIACLAFLPVRLSVLAPAELVPVNPEVVRSPLDGVVERVLVEPNQRVDAGEPLFEFDRAAISSQLQVAERTLDTLRAEYRQRGQQAVVDGESRSALAVISGRMKEQQAEVDYLQALAERGMVLAGSDGVVILDDPTAWVGRPVVTGERVLLIANEQDAELEAWVAPDDLIELRDDDPVKLYLNADPLNAIPARLRYLAYSATERPDSSFAYRARATLETQQRPDLRIGLKGTAKLSGKRVALWYYLLRKPLASLRGLLGF